MWYGGGYEALNNGREDQKKIITERVDNPICGYGQGYNRRQESLKKEIALKSRP